MLVGKRLQESVHAVVSNYDSNLLSYDCLDVRLGNVIWCELACSEFNVETDLRQVSDEEAMFQKKVIGPKGSYLQMPNEFIKARTIETFDTTGHNIAAMLSLRSKYAQAGLEQSTSVWIKPDRDTGHLILELKNVSTHRSLRLWPELAIAQIHFFEGTT